GVREASLLVRALGQLAPDRTVGEPDDPARLRLPAHLRAGTGRAVRADDAAAHDHGRSEREVQQLAAVGGQLELAHLAAPAGRERLDLEGTRAERSDHEATVRSRELRLPQGLLVAVLERDQDLHRGA